MFTWYQFTRICYYPFFNWVFPLFSKKLRDRRKFEYKNFKEPGCESFYAKNQKAHYAFEFSSEGEYEQIRPLVLKALNSNEKVELLFSSESVESHILKLYEQYPEQVRYRRLFLLSYNPLSKKKNYKNWMSSHKFYMCRYDFFPELIKLGQSKHIEFVLLWASLKSYQKAKNSFFMRKYYEYVYAQFDKIIAATPLDHAQFTHELKLQEEKLEVYDFRPVQILNRIQARKETLKNKISFWTELENYLSKYDKNKLIIYGSFWPLEVELFQNFNDQTYRHVIVPHQLDKCDDIAQNLQQKFPQLSVAILDNTTRSVPAKDILILNLKGVLCELYSYFGHAYVGGGFGISVHSLMEAFLSGAQVVCGPKVSRSTEYDLISQSHPDHLKILTEMGDFYKCISYDDGELSNLNDFIYHYKGHYEACALWAGIQRAGIQGTEIHGAGINLES
jgi:3-deoxy-D-manno-octulosonic-acid transferase